MDFLDNYTGLLRGCMGWFQKGYLNEGFVLSAGRLYICTRKILHIIQDVESARLCSSNYPFAIVPLVPPY